MTYLIEYTFRTQSGSKIMGEIRVKNADNEFVAKCKLDDYLTRKHGTGKLIVHSCIIDNISALRDLFGF